MKTENSCEFVDLLYIVVYILDEIKFSFTEFSFTETFKIVTGLVNYGQNMCNLVSNLLM